MFFTGLILVALLFGLYLALAIVSGCTISFLVLCHMRGKWPQLTALRWCALPFIILYYALWHGLRWPAYAWADYQYQRRLSADIRRLSKKLGLCSP